MFPIKKDDNQWLCEDYHPLNQHTRRDAFLMPLVVDVFTQLGRSQCFFAFDLQLGFQQVNMLLEDVKKAALIAKSSLFD